MSLKAIFIVTAILYCNNSFSKQIHDDYRQFSAFARDKILYQESDVQGLMAAQHIELDHFGHMDDPVLSFGVPKSEYGIYSKTLIVQNGSLARGAYASEFIEVLNVSNKGTYNTPSLSGNNGGYSNIPFIDDPLNRDIDFNKIWYQMRADISDWLHYKDPIQVRPEWTETSGVRQIMRASCDQEDNIYIYQISQIGNLRIEDPCKGNSSKFVVIVPGKDIEFTKIDIEITRNIKAHQILFVFPEATNLRISASGASYFKPKQYSPFGIPGTILALLANVEFKNGLITGSVFAKNLWASDDCGAMNGPGGQINFSLFSGWLSCKSCH